MKTKLLAIALSILCLVQPVAAIGMVGMESAEEISSVVETAVEEIYEEAELAGDYSAASSIIFKEDFEGYTEGQALAGSAISYVKSGFNAVSFGALPASTYTATGTTFNGRKVVKLTGTSDNYNMAEIRLPNLPLWGAGEYQLSIDYYLDSVSGSWSYFGAWHTPGNFAQTNVAAVKKPGEWNTVTIKYVVTESGTSFSILPYNPAGTAGTAITNTSVPGFTPGYTTGTKNESFTYYIDNVTWKKVVPATVTYVDASGATLGTVDATDGDEIVAGAGLDLAYPAVYTVNGETFKTGDAILVTGNMTVNVAKYVPANIPAGAIAYEDFEGFGETAYNATAVQFVQPYTYTADGYSATIKSYSTMINKYMNFNGNMVLVEKPTQDYRLGLGIHNVVLPDGEYVYTVKLYPVTAAPSSYTLRFTCGATVDVNLSQIGATITAGTWNTLEYPFTIYTENGTRKINICNGVSVHDFNGTLNVTNFATHKNATYTEEYYFDNISLTTTVPATVTYVDEQGTTLGTVNKNVGDTFTVGDGITVGYSPVYTINGEKVSAGDVVTITGNMTVNVAKYVPANTPANAIMFEDFDNYKVFAQDSSATYNAAVAYGKDSAANARIYETYTGKGTHGIASVNGSNAFKQSDSAEYAAGLSVGNLAISDLGTYTFSYKYLCTVPTGSTVTQSQFFFRFNATGSVLLNDEWSRLYIRDFTATDWQTYSKTFEIYEENGVKKIKSGSYVADLPAAGITAICGLYIPNGDRIGTTYYDDICITYKEPDVPATVTYVDSEGNTLKTADSIAGATVNVVAKEELGLNYYPVYKINGEVVNAGYAMTLTGNVTVVVDRYTPTNLPENAVVFEDFEATDDVRSSLAYNTTDASNATVIAPEGGTFSIAEFEGSNVLKIDRTINQYNNIGMYMNYLPATEVGTYVFSFDAYLVYDATNEWQQLVAPQFSDTNLVLDAENRNNKWNTYSATIKVSENDGVKKAVVTSFNGSVKTVDITGQSYFNNGGQSHIYFTNKGVGTTQTLYVDNICLTYKAPAVVNASFVDAVNARSFALEQTSTNDVYTLPTASQLGVDYTPCYNHNGITYYPGQSIEFDKDTDIEFVVSNTDVIFIANGSANPNFATGEAANAVVKGTVKDGAYECNYSGWGANLIAEGLTLGSYGTYTFDYDVINSGTDEFALHTMLYGSTSGGDGVTSIQPGVVIKTGTTHISHSVTIYEKDGAPYFKNREGKEFALDKLGYFPNVRVVTMGTSAGGKFLVDNFTITFTPYAPTLVNKANYRVKDENGKVGPAGIRFASYVTDEQYDACTEYGFVVTRKTLLGGDYTKLNLKGVTVTANGVTASANDDGVLVVAAAAYDGKVTRTYTRDGATFGTEYMGIQETFFTGILTGIPSGMEDEVFVGRPYIKIGGNIYYGNCIERCYNDFHAAQNS